MSDEPHRKISKLDAVLIALTVVLIGVFSAFLARNVHVAKQEGTFGHRPPISDILKNSGWRPSTTDAERIEPWMTFRYVGQIYGLPDDFLKNELRVTDTKYPDIPIGRYAKKNGLDRISFLSEIKRAVGAYLEGVPQK